MPETDLDFVARIGSDDGTFLGTAFLVAPQYVVTCLHVVKPKGERLKETCEVIFFAGDQQTTTFRGEVVATGDSHDLALIRLNGFPGIDPLTLLSGLTLEHEHDLLRAKWIAVGHAGRDAAFFRKQASMQAVAHFTSDQETGRLMNVQVHQGLENGFSGGPVLVSANRWCCLGIVYLGGEENATTRIILADCLVGFLEPKISDLIHIRSAKDFFKREYARRIPDAIPPRLPTLTERAGGAKSSLRIGLTLAFAALLLLATFALRVTTMRKTPQLYSDPGTTSGTPSPQPRLYDLQVVFYSGNESPRFFVNGRRAQPEYNGGIARFRLSAGVYHIKADYAERICEADIGVPASTYSAAGCHLK